MKLKYEFEEVHFFIIKCFVLSLFMQGSFVGVLKFESGGALISYNTLIINSFYSKILLEESNIK